MDLTVVPADAYDGEESPPALDGLQSPEALLKCGPIRERLLDAVVGVRTPTRVSTIAERASCDTETAREYLSWFDEMGIVRQHNGRPVQYERNDAYIRWRRIDRLREEYTDGELVDTLTDVLEAIEASRSQFGADHPKEVSLVEATRDLDLSTEAAWEALSEWETRERQAALLNAARRERPPYLDARINTFWDD